MPSVEYISKRPQAVNHLKNGNFLRVVRELTAIKNVGNKMGRTRVFKTVYRYAVTDHHDAQSTVSKIDVAGFVVPPQVAKENVLSDWDVWGASAVVSLNEQAMSRDGGNLLTIRFSENGVVSFKQSVPNFDRFRGKSVTVALSGVKGRSSVKISFALDTGSQHQGRPFFSKYFGAYYRMLETFDVPLDASKFDLTISVEGRVKDDVAISGAMLSIGTYKADLPYSDNPADVATPSGMIIMVAGDACPAGFRSIEDDAYLLAFFGDPNAVEGAVDERHSVLGENRHDHVRNRFTEFEPAIFEAPKFQFTSPPVRPEDLGQMRVRTLGEGYSGERETILPSDHAHLMSVKDEDIEPPRIRLRICQKI